MKHILIIFLFFFCAFSPSFSQTDSISVATETAAGISFVSYWELGDAYDFKITKIKKRWKDGALSKNDSSSYIARFTVLDSTATNYRIKWQYENQLTEFELPDAVLNKISEINLTEIIYTTSEMGEFIEIENWQEISEAMKSTFTILIDELTANGEVARTDLVKILQPMMTIYESKEGIESHVLKELQYFHFPFGVEFSPVDTIFYEEGLPNMFGGDPIRSDVLLYIDSVDYDNAYCVLEQRRSLNSDDTKKMLEEYFAKIAKNDKDKAEMQTVLQNAKFDIQDTNSFKYYYYPGVPVEISCFRKMIMKFSDEDQISTELTKIELQF